MKKQLLFSILVWILHTAVTPVYAGSTKATAKLACTAPTTQPNSLKFVNTYSDYTFVSFTATAADAYLVVRSTASSLTAVPVNGTTYVAGDTLGNAQVISASAAAGTPVYGLNPQTTYHIFVFAYNNSASCGGAVLYNSAAPLTATVTTPAPSQYVPSAQPTNLVFGSSTPTTISGSFTASGTYSYLVVASKFPNLNAAPVERCNYDIGNTIGNGKVVSFGAATSFTVTGLEPNSNYYVFVFAYNCNCGSVYRSAAPLSGSKATAMLPCTAPLGQPSALVFGTPTATGVSGSFTATNADGYLVLYRTAATLSAQPTNGTTYTAGGTLGNAVVLSVGNATTFSAAGLTAGTTYYFTIYALNDLCSNGPAYNTTSPLSGSVTLTATALNYYFGNFHSHSEYSDGTGLPSGDFAYGDAASCMDFLGISEHNHVSAGMSLANWNLGRAQAAAATTPTFLALYGMEWGTISTGGHVVVYGVPNLLGWDAGQYQTFVAQGDYTGTSGLFPTISSFGSNAFATLAHPNNTDFNGIMSTYNAVADAAIVGSAVENGPATSTNTTYSDPPASMSDLTFYRNMLARGYHLGPTIDHDNHNITHGHTTTGRTVVLATSLTENSILDAMRQMHFYASEDCSAYVTFKVNNNPLGSIVTSSGAPVITVTATASNPITSLKIYSGVPGSGTNATILTSSTSGNLTYTHTALTNGSTRYYYIDITESDGKRIITSPIWYSRNDVP